MTYVKQVKYALGHYLKQPNSVMMDGWMNGWTDRLVGWLFHNK